MTRAVVLDGSRWWLAAVAAAAALAHMPKLELTEDEVRAVAAYLASLR